MSAVDIVARLTLAGEQFSSEFRKRMDNVESEARSASSRINAAFGGLKAAGTALVAGLGAAAIAATAERALDYASSLGETSQQLGITTRDLQVYRYAASQVGIEQEAMDKSLAKLTLTLGQAEAGAKKPTAALRQLGLSISDLKGDTAGTAIPKIADAISKIEDPAKRASIEVALFGKTGQQLDTLLSGGGAAINSLGDAAQRLGLVLSNDLIDNADNAADKVGLLKQVLEAKIAGAVASNADKISDLVDLMLQLASAAGEAASATKIFFSLRSFAGGTNGQAGVELIKSASGRQALLAQLQSQLDQNSRDRAGGRGNRRSALGGLVDLTDAATARSNAALDRQFQALNRMRNAVLRADAVAEQASKRPPRRTGAGLSGTVDDDGSAAKKAAREAESARKKATREAAQEQRELASTLKSVEQEFDPAAAAARRYQETLADIAKLRSADKIDDATAQSYRASAMRAWYEAEAEAEQAARDKVVATLSIRDAKPLDEQVGDRPQKALDAIGELDREERERAKRRIEDLSDLYYSAFSGRSGDFWDDFADRGREVLAQMAAEATLKLLTGDGSGAGALLKRLGADAQKGAGANSLASSIFGYKSSKAGGAVGGAAGGQIGSAIGGPAGEKAGAIIGGILGGITGGLLKKTKKGSASIAVNNGLVDVGTATGNSTSRKQAATGAAGSVADALNSIAEQLGGEVTGSVSTSIGVRKKSYKVDTTGANRTKGVGVLDFGADQEAAIRAAIDDALSDGVINGISDAAKRILASGKDVEKAITEAAQIENLPRLLKARLDPVGAAMDAVNDKFAKLVKILDESGASAEQRAQAEQLYKLELEEAKSTSGGAKSALSDFLKELRGGSNSPFSLRDQEASARAALEPYLASIGKGEAIDTSKYQAAAQTYLDVERELKGSTEGFFREFAMIEEATAKAIARFDNITPISGASVDPFAAKVAANTQATAEIGAQTNDLLAQAIGLLGQVAANTGTTGGSGFIGAARNFTSVA